MRVPTMAVIACLLALPLTAQTKVMAANTVESNSFFSSALAREMLYQVVLPLGYSGSQERYPVLYLLHGWQGDEANFVSLTHLVEDASAYKLIVVTPRADNSWYVNSATRPKDRYADYVFQDLIAEVDAHYRTIASPHERAIAGISMGGYGAMLFSLRHPGAFAFAASISGAFAGPSGIESVMPQLKPSTDDAFGAAGSTTRSQNDVDTLIGTVDRTRQPYFFLECGASDPLLSSNRRVVEDLSSHGFAYEYHELPGAHTWPFWDAALPTMLKVLSRQMHVDPVSAPDAAAKPSTAVR
ncbi:MAG TPA: alpha/beta hydrolase family protein [Acidobacteriaceae bacterium]|nr:alpha/beta hydrolase family protein [Acidobacteriaceae bacterium]